MNSNEIPSAADFGLLVAWFATRGVNISAVIGTNPAGRTRAEIAAELREWARTLPKDE